jgi:hypothetical protein
MIGRRSTGVVRDPRQRLLADWEPGAWVGAVRRAFGPQPELRRSVQGEIVDAPSHWLIALWKPQRLQQPFLFRWPHVVLLHAGEDESTAIAELLQHVPWGERLWVVHDEIDWALLAEIVMLSESGLRGFHLRALHEFMRNEREATLARIARAYGVQAEALQGFVRTVPGEL